jgi:hypothetical protein
MAQAARSTQPARNPGWTLSGSALFVPHGSGLSCPSAINSALVVIPAKAGIQYLQVVGRKVTGFQLALE